MGLLRKNKFISISFGVPYFDIFDPSFSNFGVPVSVRGAISFKIKSRKRFLRQYGKRGEGLEEFQTRLRTAIIRYVKETIMSIPEKYGLPVLQLEKKMDKIIAVLQSKLKSRVKKDFFIVLSAVDITAIEVDKTSEEYQNLKRITADVETELVIAQTELAIKKMQEEQRIEMEDYEAEVKQTREGITKKAVVGGFIAGAFMVIAIAIAIWFLTKS